MYRSRLSITYLFAFLACGAAVAQGRTLVEVHEADLQQLARTRRPFKDSVAPARVLSQLSAISAIALDVPDLTKPFLGEPGQPVWKVALARLYAASLRHVLAALPSVTFLSLLRALRRELLAAAPLRRRPRPGSQRSPLKKKTQRETPRRRCCAEPSGLPRRFPRPLRATAHVQAQRGDCAQAVHP